MTRYAVILLLIVSLASCTDRKSEEYAADFMKFWVDVNDNYAYFNKKHTDWNKVKEIYLEEAKNAANREGLIIVLEKAAEELYDHHFSLNTNLSSSTRMVPSGLDIWAEWVENRVMITEVRKGYSAWKAGIKEGMQIVAINDIPVEDAVNQRIGVCKTDVDIEVKNFALHQLLAGTYLSQRKITVQTANGTETFLPDSNGNIADSVNYKSLLDHSILDKNIGYIKFNNSLGNNDVIAMFDSALNDLKNTKAMIIDLRETPSGGTSLIARGIMGRFTEFEYFFQVHVLPDEEKRHNIRRSWAEIVSPRGTFTYKKKVIVLSSHWTGSMGEGLVIGFDALGRSEIAGTRMAGLSGAIERFETSNTKIPYSFPTEQLYHINGSPREEFIPDLLIDPADPKYEGVEDAVLEAGIKLANDK